MNTSSGTVLVTARNTAVRAPLFTPTTLMAVSASRGTAMANPWPKPEFAAGHRKPSAREKPTDNEATDETRASHVIHPTWKPTRSPKASRV
ncbi:hypothetical protein COEX109129_05605 [Corallococcus exiguus]